MVVYRALALLSKAQRRARKRMATVNLASSRLKVQRLWLSLQSVTFHKKFLFPRLSLGMWNSQTVLLALIRKGLTRERAYELVQRNAMQTWATKHAGRDDADFVKQLLGDPEVAEQFKKGELEKLCSLDFHFKEVKNRFKQVGL